MFAIQTLNKIAACGLDRLPRDNYETATEIANPAGILVRSQEMKDMEIPASVLGIARAGAGVNNIPIEKCTNKGIVVFNTPGANANGVKELVIAALMLSSRKIHEGMVYTQTLKGKDDADKIVEKEKGRFVGPEIEGKTMGVIGLGAIGVMVANATSALGMKVLGYDPFISVEAAWKLSTSVQKAPSLEKLIAESDYITIHVPFIKDQTAGMFNAQRIATMKKGARLLNFSRSGLVDNQAVIAAVKSGQIGAYVTDFPEEELLGIDGVLCIPHLGASTPESEDNCAIMAVDQLREYLERGNIKNSVNFPNCEMAPSGKTRITVANKNVPNVISHLTTILGNAGLNIDDMINKNRGDVAYNIIDVSGKVPADLTTQIRAVEGVIMVRIIENCN